VRAWHHVDASERILGKLADRIAIVLMGKHKPIYDPSSMLHKRSHKSFTHWPCLADCGDYVVVTNASKVKVTGRKEQQLVYRHHTMFPGGLKEISYRDMKAKKPDEVC
jgi:large subunit ribosomal protein L13